MRESPAFTTFFSLGDLPPDIRLSYPEIFDYNNNLNLFYKNENDLKKKLIYTIKNISNLNQEIKNLSKSISLKFNWDIMAKKYDKKFESILS